MAYADSRSRGGGRGGSRGRPRSGGRGGSRGGGFGGGFRGPRREFGPREMFKATCADCGKEAEVPFKPTEGRPVYCKDCFAKKRGFEPKPPREERPALKKETEEVEEEIEKAEESEEESEDFEE